MPIDKFLNLFGGKDAQDTPDEQKTPNDKRLEELERENQRLRDENQSMRDENLQLNNKFQEMEAEKQKNQAETEERFKELDRKLNEMSEKIATPAPAETPKQASAEPEQRPVQPEAELKPVMPEPTAKPVEPEPQRDEASHKESNNAPVVSDKAVKELKEQLDKIEKLISDDLANEREKRNSIADKLADRQTKYENLSQNVQEDRYRKDKAKIINKVIFFSDLIRRMLYDFNAHRDATKAKDEETVFLEEQFAKLIDAMDDTLRHEMVETLPMAAQGDDFVEGNMEVIDTVETDDANLAGKVYRSISACYTWYLPYIVKARLDDNGNEVRHYRFVLHPEEVIIYKLNKQ